MATDLNNVAIVGRLTRDMEVKYTNSGMAIGNFNIAVNRSVKRNEQWTDEVSYIEVTTFGKTVENLQQYLVKGKQVAVSGYLKQDRWERDGQKFSKIGINADVIQLLGGNSQNSAPAAPAPAHFAQNMNHEFSDDIPFEEEPMF